MNASLNIFTSEMVGKQEKTTTNTQVIGTKPDNTLSRYRVDTFKASKAKPVPFEQLNFSLFIQCANTVSFITS